MLSDGPEFELHFAVFVILVAVIFPHLDLSCSDSFCLSWCVLKTAKTELFCLNVFVIFFVCFHIFLQLSIRLQLHTETKRSILNHSI